MAPISAVKIAAAITAVFALAAAIAAAKLITSAPTSSSPEIHAPLTRAWSSVAAWLRPPYLYVVINGIIISIAASSRFHVSNDHRDCDHREHHRDCRCGDWRRNSIAGEKLSPATSAVVAEVDLRDLHRQIVAVTDPEVIVKTVEPDFEVDLHRDSDHGYIVDHQHDHDVYDYDYDDQEKSVMIKSSTPERSESWEDKNLILFDQSPEFACDYNRKPVKPSTLDQGGVRALTVTKTQQYDTLENTWKAITEGRSTPSSRQMRKCDTWENHSRQITPFDFDEYLDPPSVKKSETFKDRTNQNLPGVKPQLVVRKEPSLSRDELNRRVEEFIKKFNEQMRLQRQESLKRYMEMINRGTH